MLGQLWPGAAGSFNQLLDGAPLVACRVQRVQLIKMIKAFDFAFILKGGRAKTAQIVLERSHVELDFILRSFGTQLFQGLQALRFVQYWSTGNTVGGYRIAGQKGAELVGGRRR